jgi:hypothetical protein
MNLRIAQKLNGELLRDKNKPARSCPQESSICTDVHTSVPHAVRGLLSDLCQKSANNNRVIRLPAIASAQARRAGAFRAAKPVPTNSNLCELRGPAVNCRGGGT